MNYKKEYRNAVRNATASRVKAALCFITVQQSILSFKSWADNVSAKNADQDHNGKEYLESLDYLASSLHTAKAIREQMEIAEQERMHCIQALDDLEKAVQAYINDLPRSAQKDLEERLK